MLAALILAIIITYAIKKAADDAHGHWQSSKAGNRRSTRGQKVSRRAASAVQHDVGYWTHQVTHGFPQVRHGLAAGWHGGRTAQAQGNAARQQARTEHLEHRARLIPEIREHRRRQQEALDQIRAAQQTEDPDAAPPPLCDLCDQPMPPGDTGLAHLACIAARERRVAQAGRPAATPPEPVVQQAGHVAVPVPIPAPTPTTEGRTAMPTASGDTTYTQQLQELQAIRRDAEEEVNSVRLKRMVSRLDVLTSLGLDGASLSEAAAIDDALQAQQKAAQQTLDMADAAISGLTRRHGGIQEAVDNSPIAQPAQPEFYAG